MQKRQSPSANKNLSSASILKLFKTLIEKLKKERKESNCTDLHALNELWDKFNPLAIIGSKNRFHVHVQDHFIKFKVFHFYNKQI